MTKERFWQIMLEYDFSVEFITATWQDSYKPEYINEATLRQAIALLLRFKNVEEINATFGKSS